MTVGYGDMYPTDYYGRSVAGSEMIVGVAFTALTTGLLFVRFSRPKAQIHYARNAVVAVHNGQPTRMTRIANARLSLISNAAARLGLMRTRRGAEGQLLRQIHELPLTWPSRLRPRPATASHRPWRSMSTPCRRRSEEESRFANAGAEQATASNGQSGGTSRQMKRGRSRSGISRCCSSANSARRCFYRGR